MRNIKFRAWDNEENKYYKPVHEAYRGNLYELLISMDGRITINTMPNLIDESLFPDKYILEQYTGMKDKKGKEIYVGDILSHQMYIKEGVTVTDLETHYSRKADVSRYGWDKHEDYGFEIIGNVHKE